MFFSLVERLKILDNQREIIFLFVISLKVFHGMKTFLFDARQGMHEIICRDEYFSLSCTHPPDDPEIPR
jgi:hypothetical protein